MSNPAGEKTEKATPRRRKKARDEGQVGKSNDLNAGIMLAVAFAALFIIGGHLTENFRMFMITHLSTLEVSEITFASFTSFMTYHLFLLIKMLLPFLSILIIVGLMANISQIGPLFTTKPLKPDIKKLNPITGFKNKFALKGLVELIKGIFKVAVIGGIGYLTIHPRLAELMGLSHADVFSTLNVIYDIIFSLSWKVCIILIVLGVIPLSVTLAAKALSDGWQFEATQSVM